VSQLSIGEVGNDVVAILDIVTFKMLVTQTAACIISETVKMPTDYSDPEVGIGKVLVDQGVNWAGHGYVNALQSQVSFLYESILLLEKQIYLWDDKCLWLVVTALSAYQDYKTKLVEYGHRTYGENWGNATDFNKKDWTDRNHLLLQHIAPQEQS